MREPLEKDKRKRLQPKDRKTRFLTKIVGRLSAPPPSVLSSLTPFPPMCGSPLKLQQGPNHKCKVICAQALF
jgi:hypothetical protein